MLNKQELKELTVRAVTSLGEQLRAMRMARGIKIKAVSHAIDVSVEEIDMIENWNIDVLNLENVIKLAAFYDKKIVVDFYPKKCFCDEDD